MVSWGHIAGALGGGVALLLFGMTLMTEAFKVVAGSGLKRLLERATAHRVAGLAAGAGITALVQSSTVTTVLVVGFVAAGLIPFQQTIGVILGANVGSTITAQIIAFKVTTWALPLIAVGYFALAVVARRRVREWGRALLGLGLIFLGMNLMTEATYPLRTHEPFVEALGNLQSPLAGLAIGAAVTALLHSSAATTGIVIVLASQGLLTVEAGIAIVLGANVGTCATALISAVGKPRTALRTATAHILFNLIGALLWVEFIPTLARAASFLPGEGLEREIANAHTLFNVVNAALFLPFTGPLARFIERLIPEPTVAPSAHETVLDPFYLTQPDLALDMAAKALGELAGASLKVVEGALPTILDGDLEALHALRRCDVEVDRRHKELLGFLGELGRAPLSPPAVARLQRLLELGGHFENAADLVTTRLVEAAEHRADEGWDVSPATREVLTDLYTQAVGAFAAATRAVERWEPTAARTVLPGKVAFQHQLAAARLHLFSRLSSKAADRVPTFRFEMELLDVAAEFHHLARGVARLVALEAFPGEASLPAES